MSWTYGIHAVESLLAGATDDVQEVWLVRSRKPGRARLRIQERVSKLGLKIREVDDRAMAGAVGEVNHQGVAARVTAFTYASAENLLAVEGPGMIVVLDEVQDPHNLGAVIRTAAGLGAVGVVIPKHRAASVNATVRKVAVGTEQQIPIAQVTNIARFLEASQAAGYWNYGFAGESDLSLEAAGLADRSVLVLGSEGRGIRRNVAAKCDATVKIPMESAESLNVSVAAGIVMWEWRRAHRNVEAFKRG